MIIARPLSTQLFVVRDNAQGSAWSSNFRGLHVISRTRNVYLIGVNDDTRRDYARHARVRDTSFSRNCSHPFARAQRELLTVDSPLPSFGFWSTKISALIFKWKFNYYYINATSEKQIDVLKHWFIIDPSE